MGCIEGSADYGVRFFEECGDKEGGVLVVGFIEYLYLNTLKAFVECGFLGVGIEFYASDVVDIELGYAAEGALVVLSGFHLFS